MGAEQEIWVRSPAAEVTEALGERLGRALGPGALVALVGDLGSGKTTLVRGLARGLEVADAVASPTFTRMRALAGRLPLYHFDAWRGGAESLFAEGAEFLAGEGIGVVEWADRVEAHLPLPRLELTLLHEGESARRIQLRLRRDGTPPSALADALAKALAQAAATPGLERLGSR